MAQSIEKRTCLSERNAGCPGPDQRRRSDPVTAFFGFKSLACLAGASDASVKTRMVVDRDSAGSASVTTEDLKSAVRICLLAALMLASLGAPACTRACTR
jgi:hypothetical protein